MQTNPPAGMKPATWQWLNKIVLTKEEAVEWLGRAIVHFMHSNERLTRPQTLLGQAEEEQQKQILANALAVHEAAETVKRFGVNKSSTNMLAHPEYKNACELVNQHKDDTSLEKLRLRAVVEAKLHADADRTDKDEKPNYTKMFASKTWCTSSH
jgi:hypothetical protein